MIVTIRIQCDTLGVVEDSIQVPSERLGQTYSAGSRDDVVSAINRDRSTALRVVRRHELDDDARAMAVKSGYTQAPVVKVTSSEGEELDLWGGFNPPRLAKWEPQADHAPLAPSADDHPAGRGPAGIHDKEDA